AIGGFHNTRTTAGTHYEPVRAIGELFRPGRQNTSQFPRLDIIPTQGAVLRKPRRAKKDYRIPNLLTAEVGERLQILRQDSQRARVGTYQKLFIQVSHGTPARSRFRYVRHFSPILPRVSSARGRFAATPAVWEKQLPHGAIRSR